MDTLTGEAADEDKCRGLGLTLSKMHAEAMGGSCIFIGVNWAKVQSLF